MSAVKSLNPKAEVARAQAALAVNISAARGLQDVLKSNLGPKGTMKMWASIVQHACNANLVLTLAAFLQETVHFVSTQPTFIESGKPC